MPTSHVRRLLPLSILLAGLGAPGAAGAAVGPPSVRLQFDRVLYPQNHTFMCVSPCKVTAVPEDTGDAVTDQGLWDGDYSNTRWVATVGEGPGAGDEQVGSVAPPTPFTFTQTSLGVLRVQLQKYSADLGGYDDVAMSTPMIVIDKTDRPGNVHLVSKRPLRNNRVFAIRSPKPSVDVVDFRQRGQTVFGVRHAHCVHPARDLHCFKFLLKPRRGRIKLDVDAVDPNSAVAKTFYPNAVTDHLTFKTRVR